MTIKLVDKLISHRINAENVVPYFKINAINLYYNLIAILMKLTL